MRRFVAALSALLLWTAAAPAADFEAGMDALGQGDYAAAYGEFLPLAEQGDTKAQVRLGHMYYLGQGVPQDYAQAVAWYRRAAEQGDADAQYELGLMYHLGWGVPLDYAEAVAWYRTAAEQGDADAQHNLGVMYLRGQGVPKDYVRAYAWLNIAATGAEGVAETAAEARDALGKGMTAAQVAEAQRLSDDLFRRIGEGAED